MAGTSSVPARASAYATKVELGYHTSYATGFLAPLLPLATSVYAVSEPDQHLARPVGEIIAASGGLARPGPTVASALARIGRDQPPGRVLICGSLYLAGEVLKQDCA